jgi:Arc/MetJ-type ribon-helix-helix transcriptional regulator
MGEQQRDYERISITVPRELADELRGMRQADLIESVSAFVTRSVAGQIDRERRHRESAERLRADFGLDDEAAAIAQQWADDVTNRRTTLSLQQYTEAARRSSAA